MTDKPNKFEDWLIHIFKDADRKWDYLREALRKQFTKEGVKPEEMKAKWLEKKKNLETDPSFKGIYEKLTNEAKSKIEG